MAHRSDKDMLQEMEQQLAQRSNSSDRQRRALHAAEHAKRVAMDEAEGARKRLTELEKERTEALEAAAEAEV